MTDKTVVANVNHVPSRLVSLDAFRGLTILGLLLVNNVALDIFTPKHFQHADWNGGVRFADMVFPWFLFIVGVALPYAAASSKKKEIPYWKYGVKAFGRMVSLVLLGCLIDSSLAKTPLFDLGVLQIIGLAFFAAALAYPLRLPWRMGLAALLLAAHWALIKFTPIPGVGVGIFTAEHNIIQHINQTYLSVYHLNGIISVVPTTALVLIGTAVGDFLRTESDNLNRRMACFVGAGVLLGLFGWLWNLDLPFNKPVWTPSYILYTAGWATVVLALMHWLIDVKGWRAWSFPLIVFGMNAIAAYVIPILVKIYVLQGWHWQMPSGASMSLQQAYFNYCVDKLGQIGGGWVYTISYIFAWWLVVFQMYRKRIFLRV